MAVPGKTVSRIPSQLLPSRRWTSALLPDET